MEATDFSSAGEPPTVKTTPVTKPTTEIVKIMSNELLKMSELNEHCNFLESDLKQWQKKIQTLTSAKNESSKILAENKNRDKVNAINSESLLQALNELNKYKCELKSSYVATEKAHKAKRLRFKKIIHSYDSTWEKALKEYNADPVLMELNKTEQENRVLEGEIEMQVKLKASTETQLTELTNALMKTIKEKTIEFSQAMIQYRQFLNSTKLKAFSKDNSDKNRGSKENFKFKLFTTEISQHIKKFSPDSNDDANFTCSIDVSVFDDITVPSENLEEEFTLTDVSKEEENLEYLNSSQQVIPSNKSSVKDSKETAAQVRAKVTDDNESHYFQQQASETLRQPPEKNQHMADQWSRSCENFSKNLESSVDKLKSVNNATELQQAESEEETSKDMLMECEESLNEERYEKQMKIQKVSAENNDSQCHKTSSFSSEDLPPTGGNPNESPEPANKSGNSKFNMEKNDFQSFTGFFTMGNDQDTSKPSIFKLF